MIGIVTLPDRITPVQGHFFNMKGYWNPPSCVIEFWAGVAKIEYFHSEEYKICKQEVLDSFNECINQFYRENAL